MRSSPDNEGFKLLSSWKTTEKLIRVSFVGIGKRIEFEGTGQIIDFDEQGLRLSGAAFELILDLESAGFDATATKAGLLGSGLNPDAYPESTEIWLESGDKIRFSTLPRTTELGSQPN